MKLNKIFMALAAMAIVGCSSDDLSVVAPGQQAAEDSQLIELNPNFVIAGVGVEDNGTRTHWDFDPSGSGALVNYFLPIYGTGAAAGQALDVAVGDAKLEQAVGLCWLGNGAVGTDVYTNYQFYHFGWLNNGETEADIDKCANPTLYNGSLYSDITPLAAVTNGAGGEALPGTDWTVATGLPSKSVKAAADNLNYNSGVYKTDNKSIFGGQYVVYYPFNPAFQEVGTIPAIAKTSFTNVPTDYKSPVIGHETFRYSAPVTIEGGFQAANFGLYNLSTLVQLRVATPDGDAYAGTKSYDQVVLVSKSGKLLKQANLAADKIVAGKKGAELYASTEGTKTITATFGAPYTLRATSSTTPKPTSAYITVLPTTVDDLEALVHNTDGTWARVDLGNTVFEAGKAKRLDIIVGKADFKSELFAVDEASLDAALTKARAIVTADPSAKPTIEVIGDITLGVGKTLPYNYFINAANDAKITIKGGDIIVPEGVTLTANTNMNSKVRVLGKACCGTVATGGRFVVQGGTINDVTMESTEARVGIGDYDNFNPMVTYDDGGSNTTITAAGTVDVQDGNVIVNSAVAHKGNLTIAEKAKLTVVNALVAPLNYPVPAGLNFMGSTVVNNGTIEVEKSGKYDMTAADGGATATDGQRMTNNGKFIHNVDAGVGTAVQKMHQNGEYRCRVNDQTKLDDAFLQWTACSVIEILDGSLTGDYDLGTGEAISTDATKQYKHNGKFIDFEVNTTTLTKFINPTTPTNADNKDIHVGNLTVVNTGGLEIDFVKTIGTPAVTGKRTLTVNGDMAVKANTTITDSKKITIKQNLTVENAATLTYEGKKQNEGGLYVTGNITVSAATFDAGAGTAATDVNALDINCANFYLKSGATAVFGNRTDGAAKNLTVTGIIDNPAGCTFDIKPANTVGTGLLAWVTCSTLKVGGSFPGSQPRVE